VVVAVVVVVVVAGEVVVVAGAGDVLAEAAGEVFAVAAGEVFAAAEGELCPKANPAGKTARRAMVRVGMIRFIDMEPFFVMRFKRSSSGMRDPVRSSDISATRADSFLLRTESAG